MQRSGRVWWVGARIGFSLLIFEMDVVVDFAIFRLQRSGLDSK